MFLYVHICNNCDFFYIGKTEELKQRTRKHKSDVIHPHSSHCKKCSEHLRTCSKMKERYFNIYLLLYEENKYLRELKERCYIMNWEPQLNSYQYIPSTHSHRSNHLKDLLRFLCTVSKGNERTCKAFNLYEFGLVTSKAICETSCHELFLVFYFVHIYFTLYLSYSIWRYIYIYIYMYRVIIIKFIIIQ